jgi:hypothetical protein
MSMSSVPVIDSESVAVVLSSEEDGVRVVGGDYSKGEDRCCNGSTTQSYLIGVGLVG